MLSTKSSPRNLTILILLKTLPEIGEQENAVVIGVQDKEQNVYPGVVQEDGAVVFQCTVEVRADKNTGLPGFYGPFVHGTPSSRFLYISWKRSQPAETLWLRRIKIPLAALTWELMEGCDVLEAEITGDRFHATVPVRWKVVPTA